MHTDGKKNRITAAALVVVLIASLVAAGCAKTASKKASTPAETAPKTLTKVNFANVGATCEAPLFAAIEKGFFKEEGLDVQTKAFSDFEVIKQALATDKNDAYLGNLEWIKPIEQGLNVKYTAGVHKGCIQGVAPKGSSIRSFKDLKGKRVGVNALGDYPFVLVAAALKDAGIDPQKDVDIKVYPGPNLGQALDKKEIDAFVMWDPIPQQYIESGKGYQFFSNSTTKPYSDRFCCLLTVRGKLVDEQPEVAAAITRGIIRGAQWVGANPDEAAKLIVEKKYVAGDVALTARLLKQYDWTPDVLGGKDSFLQSATDFKRLGFLDASTDVKALVDRSYVPVTEQTK